MRLRAIEAAKAGMKATDLALAYGVHRRTVFRWLANFYTDGEQALRAKPILSRPSKPDEPWGSRSRNLSTVPGSKTPNGCRNGKPRSSSRTSSRHANGGDGILCQRGRYPFGLSNGHDLGTGRTATRGDGHRPALLAQHVHGHESQERIRFHAERRHRHGPGFQDILAAPDGGCDESDVRGDR